MSSPGPPGGEAPPPLNGSQGSPRQPLDDEPTRPSPFRGVLRSRLDDESTTSQQRDPNSMNLSASGKTVTLNAPLGKGEGDVGSPLETVPSVGLLKIVSMNSEKHVPPTYLFSNSASADGEGGCSPVCAMPPGQRQQRGKWVTMLVEHGLYMQGVQQGFQSGPRVVHTGRATRGQPGAAAWHVVILLGERRTTLGLGAGQECGVASACRCSTTCHHQPADCDLD